MLLFGVCFIIYFLKSSNILGFWGNLRRTDKETHIIAKSYQKTLHKWMKAKHDAHFLHKCKSNNEYPKFAHCRKMKNKTPKERINCYPKNLNSAINKTKQELKTLTEKHILILKNLNDFTTCMKETLVMYSMKQQQNKLCKKMKERHQKKLDNLVINKSVNDGI